MGAFSTYKKKEMLEAFYGEGTPAELYLGYATTAMSESTTGTNVVEPDPPNGYERLQFDNDGVTWDDVDVSGAPAISITNDIRLECAQAAGGGHGTVVAIFIADAATDGNILAYENLEVADQQDVLEGNRLIFEPGDITLTLT